MFLTMTMLCACGIAGGALAGAAGAPPEAIKHPPLAEPLSMDSPNGAVRLLTLTEEHSAILELPAARVATDRPWLTFHSNRMEADGTDIPELRAALERAQPQLELVDEASREPHFDLGFAADPLAEFGEGDARARFAGNLEHLASVLMADALRQWEAGEHESAVARLATVVRLAQRSADMAPRGRLGSCAARMLDRGTKIARALQDDRPILDVAPAACADLAMALHEFDAEDPCAVWRWWDTRADAASDLVLDDAMDEAKRERLVSVLSREARAKHATDAMMRHFERGGAPDEPELKAIDREAEAQAAKVHGFSDEERRRAGLWAEAAVERVRQARQAVDEDAILQIEREAARDGTGVARFVLGRPSSDQFQDRHARSSIESLLELTSREP